MGLATVTALLKSAGFAALCLLLAPLASAQLATYQVKDLGTLGGEITEASDINNSGQITGFSATPSGTTHAFLYVAGEMRDLGTLGGDESAGQAINDLGQITGQAQTAPGVGHAFLYTAGLMTDLGVLPAPHDFFGAYSYGNDVNAAGRVTGLAAFTPAGEFHGVLYTGGSARDLGRSGDESSRGDAINDSGEVAGMYSRNFESHAFIYSAGVRTDLVPGHQSFVFGKRMLNNAGQVAGSFLTAGTTHGFLYQDGRAVDIGALGGAFCQGLAINGAGAVTGYAATADGERHAFIYSAGTMTDLGALGGEVGNLSVGYAINDLGQVAGFARAPGGTHAFVYADGKLIDLQPQLEALGVGSVFESFSNDINNRGEVIGVFFVLSDPFDPFDPLRSRGFIATPISSLLDSLIAQVSGVGPGKSLERRLTKVAAHFASQEGRETCSALRSFILEVGAQSGKSIARQSAVKWTQDARAIRAAVGC